MIHTTIRAHAHLCSAARGCQCDARNQGISFAPRPCDASRELQLYSLEHFPPDHDHESPGFLLALSTFSHLLLKNSSSSAGEVGTCFLIPATILGAAPPGLGIAFTWSLREPSKGSFALRIGMVPCPVTTAKDKLPIAQEAAMSAWKLRKSWRHREGIPPASMGSSSEPFLNRVTLHTHSEVHYFASDSETPVSDLEDWCLGCN